MTKRQAQKLIEPFSPNPGYVLDLSKQELSDIVYDLTSLELENYTTLGDSNSKRLTDFLMKHPEHADQIIIRLKEM